MALTRANVEAILVSRLGPLLTAAGMDGTTINGANLSLNDAIGRAVRQCGHSVANVVQVADGDVANISTEDHDKLFDVAEYRALESIEGNLDDVTISVGPRSQQMSDLARQVQKKLERLGQRILDTYGLQLGKLTDGMAFRDVDDSGARIEPMFKRGAFNWKIP
jgi:hypothetical protein